MTTEDRDPNLRFVFHGSLTTGGHEKVKLKLRNWWMDVFQVRLPSAVHLIPQEGIPLVNHYLSLSFLSDGEARDASMLPVPDFQTKVPLYGRDHINSRKVQAMKQAKDRKKQLARLGTGNLDFSPLSLDKVEPDFVS